MQTTFGQDTLALDNRQVRMRELLTLPVARGLQATLVAMDTLAGDDAHAHIGRCELARALSVSASTVSRRCGQLAELGLVRRMTLGSRVNWAIEWTAVLNGITPAVASVAKSKVNSQKSKVEAAETGTSAEADGEGPREISAPVSLAWWRVVLLVVLAVPARASRWVLRADAVLRGESDVTLAAQCAGAVQGRDREAAFSVRSRRMRQTLALPFPEDSAKPGRAEPVQTCAPDVLPTPQLANSDSKEIAASSSGDGKRFLRINWDACRTGPGAAVELSRLVSQGLASPEDADEWQMFVHAVKRRAGGEPLRDEKAIRSPAAYIARVVQAGTWRTDIRQADRRWLAEEVERAQRPPVAAGVGSGQSGVGGKRELSASARAFAERLAKNG